LCGLDGRTFKARASCAGGLEFKSRTGHTELQTTRYRFDILQVAVLSWRYDAELGTANSLHAST